MKEIESLRKSNWIDILRLFASIFVVAYHSQVYFMLTNTDQQTLDPIKLFFLSWTMPFFNTIATYFGIQSFLKKSDFVFLGMRIVNILKLVLIYFVIILIFDFLHNQLFSAPLFLTRSFESFSFKDLIIMIRGVNNSPLYWLFDLIFINIYSFLIVLVYKRNKYFAGALFVLMIMIFGYFTGIKNDWVNLFNFNLNIGLIGFIAGWIAFFLMQIKANKFTYLDKLPWVLIVIFLSIFGLLNIFIFKNRYFDSEQILLSFLAVGLFTVFPFLTIPKVAQSKILDLFSSWGQKYSLGIYIYHPVVYVFVDLIIVKFLSYFQIKANLSTWVLSYLITLSCTVILVVLLYRKARFSIKI